MVQDAPQIMEFQTHPCGVEVVLEEIVEGRSEGFRRTLVGLKSSRARRRRRDSKSFRRTLVGLK